MLQVKVFASNDFFSTTSFQIAINDWLKEHTKPFEIEEIKQTTSENYTCLTIWYKEENE